MSNAHDMEQIGAANTSGRTPVVFVHGLWLLPSSWDRWAALFDAAGYAPVELGWPDDPDTVAEAHEHPEAFANKTVGDVADYLQLADQAAEIVGDVADYLSGLIGQLAKEPAIVGHSFGGLLTQILAGRGLSAA